jgi:hypothetical protein
LQFKGFQQAFPVLLAYERTNPINAHHWQAILTAQHRIKRMEYHDDMIQWCCQ